MHAGTARDLANRAVAKQLLAPPDWGRLAAPLIRVAHTIVQTTSSVNKGEVHGAFIYAWFHPRLVSSTLGFVHAWPSESCIHADCVSCLQKHLDTCERGPSRGLLCSLQQGKGAGHKLSSIAA